MIHQSLYDDGSHRWLVLGRDPGRSDSVIDTNEYVIVSGTEVLLLDPGGTEIFPALLQELSQHVYIEQIRGFFCSHQDPDIFSSLSLWCGLCPEAKVYLSWRWSGFVAHFGHEFVPNFVTIPDEGMAITLGRRELQAIPAHYCHSSGNFSLYDPEARILFSGDIGAALLPPGEDGLFVTDFDRHIQYMRGFHVRWMPSNEAKNAWIERVRRLEVDMLCPQHGAIFRGDDVKRFLDWLEGLQVGQAGQRESSHRY